jgi:protein CpxP
MHKQTRIGFARTLAYICCVSAALSSGAAFAQDSSQAPPPNGDRMSPPPLEQRRPPMERAFHLGPPGRWWNNPAFAAELGLSPDQQKRMEAVFEQNRPELIDLSTAVQKEEANMEPLLSVDQPDESKVLMQIDRIAQARAQLEKANARMLLGLRRVLTQDQWKKLEANDPGRHPHFGPMPHSHDGLGRGPG